ncbi:omptin family outer membrane protease [Aestuariivirga sp.]|jgi:outer membrane protease|uniref:omptin family outer membrane protease n=1 Tax=Aestuariivirga sp. TaxID=2650926 RepID=UPI00378475CD
MRSASMLHAGVALWVLAGTAFADGVPDLRPSVTIWSSLGHLSGKAKERVYNPDGSKLSELVWDMENALVLNVGMTAAATERISFYGNASIGLAADSKLNNYDWIGAPPPADPDLHSWHDDTELDHYYTLDAGLSFALLDTGSNRFSVLGGFKYTDTQWTARGGCYDYEFFGVQGCFEDGEKGITYRQLLPAVYAGLGYLGSFDRWSFSVEGRAGYTLNSAEAQDNHWLRDRYFVDYLQGAPYAAVNGKAGYAVSQRTSIFGSVAYDKFFEMNGETSIENTVTGDILRTNYDSGGADLYTLNMAVGLDYAL